MKITASQYAKTLYVLTAGKSQVDIDAAVSGLAEILQNKNQIRLMPKIIEKFSVIWNKENGVVEAEVMTREKLNDEMAGNLNEFLKKKFNAKKVVINNTVNESIKGGIIIRVGDEVMDGSVERKLKELRSLLVH